MPVNIDFCILCESVRPEPNGKANILGFYGVLPDAAIQVGELGKPVETLMFLMGMSGDSPAFSVTANILNPDGSILVPSKPAAAVNFPELKSPLRGLGGLLFQKVIFTHPGAHVLQVFVEGREAYKRSFLIGVGVAAA
jgi:hypothetical protein